MGAAPRMLRPAPNELVRGNGPPQDSPGSDPTTVTHIGAIEYVNRTSQHSIVANLRGSYRAIVHERCVIADPGILARA
jgi:hypothetical protein